MLSYEWVLLIGMAVLWLGVGVLTYKVFWGQQ